MLEYLGLLVYVTYLFNLSFVISQKNEEAVSCVLDELGFFPPAQVSCKFNSDLIYSESVINSLSTLKTILENLKVTPYTGRDCSQLLKRGDVTSGVRVIYPFGSYNNKPGKSVAAYCDQATDGGGWTVFQNRDALPTREKFERKWGEYVQGFGEVNGEFWLGLENLHALVQSTPMELRIDLMDYDGVEKWAKYSTFSIGNSSSKYILDLGLYSEGTAGDSLSVSNGIKFSTYDQDNDEWNGSSCAKARRGAWWYRDCSDSNLSGYQYVGNYSATSLEFDGVFWHSFRTSKYSLKQASMKVRPISF